MVPTRFRLSSLAPAGGVACCFLAAVALALLPDQLIETVVHESGLPVLLPAASPPLGMTARAILAIAGGVGAGLVAWAALFLLFGPGGAFAREGGVDGVPTVRRADAHPDAPPRRPFSAADLDAPPVELAAAWDREPPRDLDRSLAASHPRPGPDQPREPPRPVSPIRPAAAPLAPGERISTFEIPPRDTADPGASSIESLLARLERGTQRRRRELGRAG